MPALARVLNWVITVILTGMIVFGIALYVLLPNTPAPGVLIATSGALGLFLSRVSRNKRINANRRLAQREWNSEVEMEYQRRELGALDPERKTFSEAAASTFEHGGRSRGE